MRAVVAAVLASPNFLFKPEFGGGDATLPNATQVTPFELASRLASLLWASVPDEPLLDAAANGQLETRAQVEMQARRMLKDDRARPALERVLRTVVGSTAADQRDQRRHGLPDLG